MAELSAEQEARRADIRKGATVLGVIAGVVVGLVVLLILGGQGAAVRFGGALVAGGAAGGLAFRARFNARAASARCGACGAAFSLSRTDRTETPASSNDRVESVVQDDGSTKVTSWIEDTFDVVDSYACARCGDVTTRAYKTTRRRNEETVIEPPEGVEPVAETADATAVSAEARSKRARARRR